jgi:hypothetical protein
MTTPLLPTRPPCFPGTTDWLDGKWELEEGLPKSLRARWDADILDQDDKNKHDTIIEQDDSFLARFRVELKGKLWKAITGTWCFDMGFTIIGKPTSRGNFNLSELIPSPADLCVPDWTGCKTQCILVEVTVPASLIPANKPSTTYEVAASFTLLSCDQLVLAGRESLEEFLFTRV